MRGPDTLSQAHCVLLMGHSNDFASCLFCSKMNERHRFVDHIKYCLVWRRRDPGCCVRAGAGVQERRQGKEAAPCAQQEGDHFRVRLPTPGCGGLQEDEPSAQGALLRAPQDRQGANIMIPRPMHDAQCTQSCRPSELEACFHHRNIRIFRKLPRSLQEAASLHRALQALRGRGADSVIEEVIVVCRCVFLWTPATSGHLTQSR